MNISVINKLNDAQIEKLHLLYQNEWFTKGRSIGDVREMLNKTDFVFGFCAPDSEELIGFARVISDWVYKAFVFDVIVDPSFRGQGLGNFIMNTIFEHAVLKEVSHIELYCAEDLAPFYEKMGFERRISLLLRRISSC
jgi:predicted GNAT family N-acyltransferase